MGKSIAVALESHVFLTLALNDLIKDGCSLVEFLSFLDIPDIEEYILRNYYKRTPQYCVGGMIRLTIAYYFENKGFKKLMESLTKYNAKLLKLKNIPSHQNLHDFIHYRLKEKGFEELMDMIAVKLNKLTDKANLSIDSTPIEASRYDRDAEYNPHYKCNMYKAHITMKDTIPLLMTFSNGTANDSPYLKPHAYKLNELGIRGDFMNLDGGYDSFENHAFVKHVIGAWPYISIREDAVVNKEGTVERINHWCNKLWKKGGRAAMHIHNKLQFLFEQGREEQVGAYYRNRNLKDGIPSEKFALRSRQERIHEHIKTTVKFDVRGRHTKKKGLHIKAAFVSYQLLVLNALQNGLNPNEFGFVH